MGDYTVIAIILIAIQLVAGYAGALLSNRLTGRKLPAFHVLLCGVVGALLAIAIVLSALPYFLGLVGSPIFGALAVWIWHKVRKN